MVVWARVKLLTLSFGWLVEIVGPQELLRVGFSVVVDE
jgi:hypothetical protein